MGDPLRKVHPRAVGRRSGAGCGLREGRTRSGGRLVGVVRASLEPAGTLGDRRVLPVSRCRASPLCHDVEPSTHRRDDPGLGRSKADGVRLDARWRPRGLRSRLRCQSRFQLRTRRKLESATEASRVSRPRERRSLNTPSTPCNFMQPLLHTPTHTYRNSVSRGSSGGKVTISGESSPQRATTELTVNQ